MNYSCNLSERWTKEDQLFPGPWFNIMMSCYQYRKSHCWDKTIVRSSYFHNGIAYTGKMASLYWTNPLMLNEFFIHCTYYILGEFGDKNSSWIGCKGKSWKSYMQDLGWQNTLNQVKNSWLLLIIFPNLMQFVQFLVISVVPSLMSANSSPPSAACMRQWIRSAFSYNGLSPIRRQAII